MVDVQTEIIINQSSDIVSAYAVNPLNAPSWYKNIQKAVYKKGESIKVGSQIEFIAHFLGKKLKYTYEIREFAPGEKIVMSTSEGPFPMETSYKWEPKGDKHTLMKLRNRGNPKGFSKLFKPIMGWMMKKANNKDLFEIKKILENYTKEN